MQSSLKKALLLISNPRDFHYIHSMKCRIILGLSAILFFTGCYNREHISRLDEAEALLQNKPDSALTILKQLRQEGSQAEQARYALLYSEALDKNHIKVTDDSLIRQAWTIINTIPKIYDTNVRLSIIGDEQTTGRRQTGSIAPFSQNRRETERHQ